MGMWTRYSRQRAVKEAIDNLPTGICFFDAAGNLMLCNHSMYQLVYRAFGIDLQELSELRRLLEMPPHVRKEADTYIFPDNTAWLIKERAITDNQGDSYIQFTASEVTDLYQSMRQLKEEQEKTRDIANHLEQLNHNITAIAREEEILSMKMRVHNELGSTLLNINHYVEQGCQPPEKADLIAALKRTTAMLLEGIGGEDATNDLAELLQIGQSMGVEIVLTGEPIPDTHMSLILSAIRECLTNAIGHAAANRLFVDITGNAVTITNNGAAPQAEIVEGGWLTSLRKQALRAGATMQIISVPEFKLILTY